MIQDTKTYDTIYELRKAWRMAGGNNDTVAGNYSVTDTPGHFYFKIFFHFNTGSGLLNSAVDPDPDGVADTRTPVNTALNYLNINNEFERYDMLQDFITLLSNISSQSPWYFQKVSGLDKVLTRNEFGDDVKEDERSIEIECLEDAYDNRIGTLLDLYRAVCYSHTLHKVIVPANLRRFDMSIYIFNTPVLNMHGGPDAGQESATFGTPDMKHTPDGSRYYTSSKMIELHGCEIDLNSSTTGYADLDNGEGFAQKYKIKINYINAVEQRYNELLNCTLGDLVVADLDHDENFTRETMESFYRSINSNDATKKRLEALKDSGSSILGQLLNPVARYAQSKLNKLTFGNLFYGSLTVPETNINPARTINQYTEQALNNADNAMFGWTRNVKDKLQQGRSLFK